MITILERAGAEVVPESMEILSNVEDVNGVLADGQFFNVCDELLGFISNERKSQGIGPISDNFKCIFAHELFRVCSRFSVFRRKDGTSVFYSHLVGTLRILIMEQGITDIASLIAMMNHDTVEDFTPKSLNGDDRVRRESELMDDLVLLKMYKEFLKGFDQVEADAIITRVKAMVRGVTKWRQGKREVAGVEAGEEDINKIREATFERFLDVITENVMAAFLKISDRRHNMSTISGHGDNEAGRKKQADIVNETVDIYLPLARILKIRESVRYLVRDCINFQNPQLLKEFEEFLMGRYEKRLNPYMEGIVGKFSQKSDQGNGFIEGVRSVTFDPRGLEYYTADHSGSFADLQSKDLPIARMDPMFEIIVKVDSEFDEQGKVSKESVSRKKKVLTHIVEKFASDQGSKVKIMVPDTDEDVVSDGIVITIFNKNFGGQLYFRVNYDFAESRKKRGVLANYSSGISNDLRPAIQEVVRASRMRKKLSHAGGIEMAKKELLRPRFEVFKKDGDRLEVSGGATVLDFAAKIHEIVLLGAQRAWVVDDLSSANPEREVSLTDRLEPGKLYIVENVGKRDPSVKVHPSWLLFAQADARHKIRKYLKNPGYNSDAQKKGEVVMDAGHDYIQHLSRLFGITVEEFKRVLERRFTAKKRSDLVKEVGMGSIDPVAIFAELCEDREAAVNNTEESLLWEVEFKLPDRIGELQRFSEAFSVEAGVDIFHIDEHVKNFEPGYDALRLKFDIIKSGISMYDFFKILVKVSYLYSMRMVNNPYKEKRSEKVGSFTRPIG